MQNEAKIKLTRVLVFMGIMTALAVICGSNLLTFRVGQFMKFSPSFLIIGITAAVCGWKEAGLVSLLADVIQGLLFPPISIFIALINLLSGLCFGLFLYKKASFINITLSVLTTQIIGSLGLITAVLVFEFGLPFYPIIYWRMLQTLILIIAEISLLYLFLNVLKLPLKMRKILTK